MHGAAQAAVEAVVFGEDFRQRAIDKVIYGQVLGGAGGILFDDAQGVAAEVIAHNLEQGVIGQLGDGREAFGQDFSVAAMGAVNMVLHPQQVSLAHGGGFLADRKMSRAAVIVFDAVEAAAQLDFVEHVLEGSNNLHIALDAQKIGLGKALGGEFLFAGFAVLVDRNGGEFDLSGAAVLDGIDE